MEDVEAEKGEGVGYEGQQRSKSWQASNVERQGERLAKVAMDKQPPSLYGTRGKALEQPRTPRILVSWQSSCASTESELAL